MAEPKTAKVLVVDDEPDTVEMLKMMLENASYEVVTAHNGQVGVTRTKEEKPDLVVMDLMMPEMNGFEACSEIKADPELAHTPVLVLTAISQHISHSEYAKSLGLELESDDYIDKPVDPEMLLKRIADLLGE